MEDEKRLVYVEMKSEITYILRSRITKEEYKKLRKSLYLEKDDEDQQDVSCSDIAFLMKDDLSSLEPDKEEGTLDFIESEWDDDK